MRRGWFAEYPEWSAGDHSAKEILRMQKLRVQNFSVSLDGYSAGPNQSIDQPLGAGGTGLMEWFFQTRTFQEMHNRESRGTVGLRSVPEQTFGDEGGRAGIDDELAARGFENVGAWIIGRNMFGPIRGAWPNDDWKGWWGDDPPYRCDVFVLTHHARASLAMEGGTTFHFVTDGIESAWERARAAAKGKDVRLGGGIATVQAYLRAGLVDELHLAQSPVLLGTGESLFAGVDLVSLGYYCVKCVPSAKATHLLLRRSYTV
jgi:dihydrofolate reductase